MIQNKRFIQSVTSLVALMLLIGCSSQQKIRIISDPPQAKIIINDREYGNTPIIIKVKKKEAAPTIIVKKEGFETEEIKTTKSFNIMYPVQIGLLMVGWSASRFILYGTTKHNVISTSSGLAVGLSVGIIGGIFTGDYYKFSPKKIKLSLKKFEKPPTLPTPVNDEKELISPVTKEQENNSIITDSSSVIDTVETKPVDNTGSTQQPESQMPEKELKIGTPTTIITNTDKEFSGTLVNESTNKYVLDVNGNKLDIFKNTVKDIQQ
jgi:hypothetical protein